MPFRKGRHLAPMRRAVIPSFFFAATLFGQGQLPPRITFDLIGVNEGLPHALVECFLEDDRGSLWVGMQQGLAVYDGNDFVSVDIEADGSPIGVRNLTKDGHGIIWVAAEQGPVRVDPVSRRAQLVSIPDSLKQGVETLWAHAVVVTGPNELLFGTHVGTFFLNTVTRTFRGLRYPDGAPVKTFWRDMLADTVRHGIWITTHDRGLVFYHTATGRLYVGEGDRAFSPLIAEKVVSLCHDGDGGLWCSDPRTGNIWHWDGTSSAVRAWDHVPGAPGTSLSTAWFLGRDRNGRIWGSASKPGGFRFDPKDGSAVVFDSEDLSAGSLPYGTIRNLYHSPSGEVWLANLLGIAIHDPAQPQMRFFDVLSGGRSGRIWSMEFSGDSLLWCAMGEEGLARIDLSTGAVTRIPLVGRTDKHPVIWDVLPRGDAVIVSSDDDVWSIDVRTTQAMWIHVRDTTGTAIPRGRTWLSHDADGTIWKGVNLFAMVNFDPRTGRGRVHRPDSLTPGGMRFDNVYGAASAKNGSLWSCGNLRGLTWFDRKSGHWTDLFADVREHRLRVGRLVGITASSDSVLWLASDGAGLVRYDIPTGAYTHYDHRHGITESGLVAVAVDARKRIWVISDERLFCFDPIKERAVVVGPRGSGNEVASKWILGTSSGGLLAYNVGRSVAVFDANPVGNLRTPPAPILAQVLVDGIPMALTGEDSLVMRYDNEQLEVHFGAILPPGWILAYAMREPGGSWVEYKEGRINLRGLQPGEHTFQFRLVNLAGEPGPPTTLNVMIPPPWYQTLAARILFAVLLAMGIVLVFRARLNWIRKRERAQEEQARQVNELKLQALRAQMDPHFVFNCLNSIDSFIIANDREQASHYLGRFAKLIRLILQHSDSTRVPLEREVEMLRYYLELEALRFKTPFTFEVVMDEQLEGEPVELPTMLVQPYIENAIWHGLRHKESAGHLSVTFALRDDHLECVVEDNGIGREASRRINEQRSGIHKSMGMRVSADRLRIYGELERGASRVMVEDLKDPQGSATGTRVIINFPLMVKETEQ